MKQDSYTGEILEVAAVNIFQFRHDKVPAPHPGHVLAPPHAPQVLYV